MMEQANKINRPLSGFQTGAREAIMSWCEDNKVFYCLGLARNDRLSAQLQGHFESLTSPRPLLPQWSHVI